MIKKLGKKKFIIISLCLLLVLAGSVVFFVWKNQGNESTEEEIVLKQGQSLVYGQIVSIYGNEITYYVMEEQDEVTEESQTSQGSEENGEMPQMPGGESGEMPQMPGGEMPQGNRGGNRRQESLEDTGSENPQTESGDETENAQSERPQMPSGESGERPQMPDRESGERPQMTEGEKPQMPSGAEGGMSGMRTGGTEENVQNAVETITVQIPVGTQVTTRLGTVTTFSRLAAGDNIKMLVQEKEDEQIILEIWIVD